jgi:Leucine-rich repeat (LRR) protein
LKIGTIPSAEGALVKAGNLQCTGRDLDALGRCAGRDDCPASSETTLNLSLARVRDVSPLKDLKSLATLDLSYNPVSDVSPLKDLKSLQIIGP